MEGGRVMVGGGGGVRFMSVSSVVWIAFVTIDGKVLMNGAIILL